MSPLRRPSPSPQPWTGRGGGRLPMLGLVGGIASGKSLVARTLCDWGAGGLDADRAGHEVLAEPEVRIALQQRFGNDVFRADGEVDRAALAGRVFAPGSAAELEFLEQLTHPRIEAALRRQAAEWIDGGQVRALVLDAPLLLRAGWNRYCALVAFVDAPRAVRVARAAARGWSEAELDAREARQEPLEVKRRAADVVIDNSGDMNSDDRNPLRPQLERLWERLLSEEG